MTCAMGSAQVGYSAAPVSQAMGTVSTPLSSCFKVSQTWQASSRMVSRSMTQRAPASPVKPLNTAGSENAAGCVVRPVGMRTASLARMSGSRVTPRAAIASRTSAT